MIVFRHYLDVGVRFRASTLVIGNMDGVHLGHQALIKYAQGLGVAAVQVLSFSPHPKLYFKPDTRQYLLMSDAEKSQKLEQIGVSNVLLQRFDREFAALSGADFVEKVLVKLKPDNIVVGRNFTFGKGGLCDSADLFKMCAVFGIKVHVFDDVFVDDKLCSSTLVRKCLKVGNLQQARNFLGHPYTFRAEVVGGDQRGRKLGYPTANLKLHKCLLIPFGVYATRITFIQIKKRYNSVSNYGLRPTFNKKEACFETLIFDYDANAYGQEVEIELLLLLRDERKMESLDALKKQIKVDVEQAKAFLQKESS